MTSSDTEPKSQPQFHSSEPAHNLKIESLPNSHPQPTMPPPLPLPNLTLIVAATSKMGIGLNGTLPWGNGVLKKEMAYFARVTRRIVPQLEPPAPAPLAAGAAAGQGIEKEKEKERKRLNAVLMGRKTWDSVPEKFRPLKGRVNVVLSRGGKKSAEEEENEGRGAEGKGEEKRDGREARSRISDLKFKSEAALESDSKAETATTATTPPPPPFSPLSPSQPQPKPQAINLAKSPLLAHSLPEALKALSKLPDRAAEGDAKVAAERIFIIGGAQIYGLALGYKHPDGMFAARRILLTRVEGEWECDTFFPVELVEDDSGGDGEKEGGKEWKRSTQAELSTFVGEDVPEGWVEESGVRYRFEMWER